VSLKSPETKMETTGTGRVTKPTPASAKLRASLEGLSLTASAAADLLEEGDRAHAGIATDARDLLLSEIEPDPQQPRRHFDATDLDILADDIARRGVLQPVLVRPPISPGQPYRLVAGERRWRAARLAGKVRIPARIREIADEDVQAAQLAENILRAGLTDIEKGRALRRLYELRKTRNYKTTWENIANEVGLGRARINDLFSLASLPDSVAGLIESGRLTGSHGIALQRAQEHLLEKDIIALAHEAARPEGKRNGGYALTVAALRHRLQEHIGQGPDAGPDALAASSTKASQPQDGAQTSGVSLKPFIRRTLKAVASGMITVEEYNLLIDALRNGPPYLPVLDQAPERQGNTGTVENREGDAV